MTTENFNLMAIRPYESLELTDNFLFTKIMYENTDLCKEVLELVLQVRIGRLVSLQYERTMFPDRNKKGVRFDVYTEDDSRRLFDLEMQVTDEKDLPKRSRYYHSMIDIDQTDKGEIYSNLKETYVVFICKKLKDAKDNLPVYTYRYRCEENGASLGDGTTTVIVNAGGSSGNMSDGLKDFLDLIRTGKTDAGSDTLAGKLMDRVKHARLKEEWRMEYVTYEQELMYRYHKGREEGREEGLKEGREEGRNLIRLLLANGDITEEQAKKYLAELAYSEADTAGITI